VECNNCGSGEFSEVHNEEYGGHKGGRNRDGTEKTIYKCESCGSEGRKLVDGVDGRVTRTGVLR